MPISETLPNRDPLLEPRDPKDEPVPKRPPLEVELPNERPPNIVPLWPELIFESAREDEIADERDPTDRDEKLPLRPNEDEPLPLDRPKLELRLDE